MQCYVMYCIYVEILKDNMKLWYCDMTRMHHYKLTECSRPFSADGEIYCWVFWDGHRLQWSGSLRKYSSLSPLCWGVQVQTGTVQSCGAQLSRLVSHLGPRYSTGLAAFFHRLLFSLSSLLLNLKRIKRWKQRHRTEKERSEGGEKTTERSQKGNEWQQRQRYIEMKKTAKENVKEDRKLSGSTC